jgi:hypothetical protein
VLSVLGIESNDHDNPFPRALIQPLPLIASGPAALSAGILLPSMLRLRILKILHDLSVSSTITASINVYARPWKPPSGSECWDSSHVKGMEKKEETG